MGSQTSAQGDHTIAKVGAFLPLCTVWTCFLTPLSNILLVRPRRTVVERLQVYDNNKSPVFSNILLLLRFARSVLGSRVSTTRELTYLRILCLGSNELEVQQWHAQVLIHPCTDGIEWKQAPNCTPRPQICTGRHM